MAVPAGRFAGQCRVGRRSDYSQSPNAPTVLYNGMIAPLLPYAMRGVIWYQGEANVGRERQYRTLFPAMIADWRQAWGEGGFPFLFVQIAPYNEHDAGNSRGAVADLATHDQHGDGRDD